MNDNTLDNCKNTLSTLKSFLEQAEKNPSEFARAAVIQAFEFTYEVYWKTFQKIGRAEGVMVSGPKSALSYAYQAGYITDQELWLALMNDRNLTTHIYHEGISKKIYENVARQYVAAFEGAYLILIKGNK